MSDTIHPEFRIADGLRIRCAESDGPRDQVVLLLHPWPESLYAWQSMWPALAQQAHLVAIDLPGFGKSERRIDLFSPRAMGEFVIKLIDEWELESPHVIGPDVGSGAALFAAARHPGVLSSLIVGSGGSAYPLQVTGSLKDIIDAPDIEAFRALDARMVVGSVLDTIERHKLPDFVREDYLESYEGDRFAESTRYVRAYPIDLCVLRDLLPHIQIPVQLISGRHDPLVPISNVEYLHERLPHSKLDVLETGHFAWEDGADEYETLASAWLAGGYKNLGSSPTASPKVAI
jgi:pimeloyl-ACP methyl ester carboxylesterase